MDFVYDLCVKNYYMGYVHGSEVARVAIILLKFLKEVGEITFDHFYDGTDETMKEFNSLFDFPEDDDESIVYLDFAIDVLTKLGMIETEQLNEKLADDEPNFRIRNTEKGGVFAWSGQELIIKDFEA